MGSAPAGLVNPIAILLPFIFHSFFATSLTAVFPFSLPPSFSLPCSLPPSSSSSPLSLLETRSYVAQGGFKCFMQPGMTLSFGSSRLYLSRGATGVTGVHPPSSVGWRWERSRVDDKDCGFALLQHCLGGHRFMACDVSGGVPGAGRNF